MKAPEPSICVNVDVTNPGQFFACCGLLELADRLWPGAEGWFRTDNRRFCVDCPGTLTDVLACAQSFRYIGAVDSEEDDTEDGQDESDERGTEPLVIQSPFEFRLDWWEDKSLKTWAGSMKVNLIAAAMSNAIDPHHPDPLNQSQIVFDVPQQHAAKMKPRNKGKKREPFYFDSRRGMNSHSIDVGFSANDLKLLTLAYPVVEFLCLVGLQRSRPLPTSIPRVFEYWTWHWRCNPQTLSVAVTGLINDSAAQCLRFENGFRSGQKKHKAFRSAVTITQGV